MAISYQQLKPSYTFQYWSQISSQIAVDRSTKVLVATTTTRHPSDQMIWSRKWKQSPGWQDWLILVITEYNWWRGSSWYLNYWSGSALSHHSKQNRGGAREPLYNLCSLINKRLLWYVVCEDTGVWSVDIEDDTDTDNRLINIFSACRGALRSYRPGWQRVVYFTQSSIIITRRPVRRIMTPCDLLLLQLTKHHNSGQFSCCKHHTITHSAC